MGIIKGLFNGLEKTKKGISEKIYNVVKTFKIIDEDLFEELEDILILSDLGMTVTKDILDFALVYGSPAKQVGWMCACGEKLEFKDNDKKTSCLACKRQYINEAGKLNLV